MQTDPKVRTPMAIRRRERAQRETRLLLQPLIDKRVLVGLVLQCGLGDWAEGPVLLDIFESTQFMAIEPIQRFAYEAWQSGFRGPIIQGALWDKTGKVVRLQDFRSRTSMLDKTIRRGEFSATTLTLDDAVKFIDFNHSRILLWMDCEGVELTILEGAKETLKKTVAIVCELKDNPKLPDWPTADVVQKHIEGLGYKMWHRVADNGLFVRE